MGPKVKDTVDKGSNRAGVGMSTAGMAHNFAGIGTFLGREGECCKGGKGELCGVCRGSGEGLVADREGNILEAEWLVGGARSRMGVLGWRRKQKPRVVRVAVATDRGLALVQATTLTWLTIGKGMGLTRMSGGSIRL